MLLSSQMGRYQSELSFYCSLTVETADISPCVINMASWIPQAPLFPSFLSLCSSLLCFPAFLSHSLKSYFFLQYFFQRSLFFFLQKTSEYIFAFSLVFSRFKFYASNNYFQNFKVHNLMHLFLFSCLFSRLTFIATLSSGILTISFFCFVLLHCLFFFSKYQVVGQIL